MNGGTQLGARREEFKGGHCRTKEKSGITENATLGNGDRGKARNAPESIATSQTQDKRPREVKIGVTAGFEGHYRG